MIDAEQSASEKAGPDEGAPGPDAQFRIGEGDATIAHDLRPVHETIEGNQYSRNTIIVHGDFLDGSGHGKRALIPTLDLTEDPAAPPEEFVEPAFFAELLAAVKLHRVVLLVGPGRGKRTAVDAALRAAECDPILQMPSDVAARSLIDAVESVCAKRPSAGILIDSVDSKTLVGFAGFELRRLRSALPAGAAVVLTTRARDSLQARDADLPVVDATDPANARAIVESVARQRDLSEEAVASALGALELLDPLVSPGGAVALVEAARTREAGPEELAAIVRWDSSMLDEWLRENPSAEHVGWLAAAATLDGVPTTEIEGEALRLLRLLDDDADGLGGTRTFGLVERTWPAGLVEVRRETFATHFGRHEAEVLAVSAPHTRDRIVTYLWRHLGAGFRRPYLGWLRELAANRSTKVRLGAAVTAGVLFIEEPITAERELLRPWALDDRPAARVCAALGVGLPVALGADPAPARALAKAWATADNRALRHTAVIAYGDVLGAWDPASAAPVHLWRIAADTPELRLAAQLAFARLVAAGRDAQRVRATVIALLASEVELRPTPRRVFEMLPLVFDRLTAEDESARESLAALLDNTERDSLQTLASLLATALDRPPGHQSGRAAVEVLLLAIGQNRIRGEVFNRVVREMKRGAAEHGRLHAVGSQLERVLKAAARADGPRREPARAALATFYVSNPRERKTSPTISAP